jgi:transposase
MSQVSDKQRARIVHAALVQKRRSTAIAREQHVSVRTVNRVLARFAADGELTAAPRVGRPGALSAAQWGALSRRIKEHPTDTAATIAAWMLVTHHVRCSERSVRRWRRDLGYTPHRERIVPLSTPEHDAARHAYALAHQGDNVREMIFEDEMTLCLRDTGRVYWLRRGEAQPQRQVGNLSASVNIIGIIWWGGSVFHRFTGHLNADAYIAFLNAALLRHAPVMSCGAKHSSTTELHFIAQRPSKPGSTVMASRCRRTPCNRRSSMLSSLCGSGYVNM